MRETPGLEWRRKGSSGLAAASSCFPRNSLPATGSPLSPSQGGFSARCVPDPTWAPRHSELSLCHGQELSLRVLHNSETFNIYHLTPRPSVAVAPWKAHPSPLPRSSGFPAQERANPSLSNAAKPNPTCCSLETLGCQFSLEYIEVLGCFSPALPTWSWQDGSWRVPCAIKLPVPSQPGGGRTQGRDAWREKEAVTQSFLCSGKGLVMLQFLFSTACICTGKRG